MKHSLAICSIIANGGSRCSRVAVMSRKISSSTSFSLKIFTALIGSPTYLGSLNRMVLTSPAPFRSRQGITRVANTSAAFGEVLEKPHAEAVALLGMKLHSHQVFVLETGIKRGGAMPHPQQLVARVVARHIVRMREVKPRLVRTLLQEDAFLRRARDIPTHVRDF